MLLPGILRMLRRHSQAYLEALLSIIEKQTTPGDFFNLVEGQMNYDYLEEQDRMEIEGDLLKVVDISAGRAQRMGGVRARFSVMDPVTYNWIEDHSAKLVKGMLGEDRGQIQVLLAEAAEEGVLYDRATAFRIGQSIGLTPRQWNAYRKQVERWRQAGVSGRELDMARKQLFNKKLSYRGRRIARTEAAFAASEGERRSYERLGIEQFDVLLGPAPCSFCLEMAGGNPHDLGTPMPPYHPNCTCDTVMSAGQELQVPSEVTETPETPWGEAEEKVHSDSFPTSKPLGGGVNKTRLVGNDIKGVFKPETGMEVGTPQAEEAFCLLDRRLGFNRVPPTTVRNVGGRSGSLQYFVDDATVAFDIGDPDKALDSVVLETFDEDQIAQLRQVWIEDIIAGNTDRHDGNWMLSESRGVVAIDNGASFWGVPNEMFTPTTFPSGASRVLPSSKFSSLEREAIHRVAGDDSFWDDLSFHLGPSSPLARQRAQVLDSVVAENPDAALSEIRDMFEMRFAE